MDSEYEVNPEKISPNSGDSTPAEEPSDMSIDVPDSLKLVEKEDRQEQTDFNESPKYSRSKPIFKESKSQMTEPLIRPSSRLEKIPESSISIKPDKRQGLQNISSSIDKKSEDYFESIAASPVRLKQSTIARSNSREVLKFLEAESLDFHLQTSELQESEAIDNSKSKNLKHQELLYLLSSESSGELEEIGAKLIGETKQEKNQNHPGVSGIKPKNKKQQLRSSKKCGENPEDIEDRAENQAIDIKAESSDKRSLEKLQNTKNHSESPENNARLSVRAEKIANIPKLVIKKSPERSKKFRSSSSSSSEKEVYEEKAPLSKAAAKSQLFAEDFNQNKLNNKVAERLNASHKRTSSQEYIDQDKSIERITLKIRKSERADRELRKNRSKKRSDSSSSSRNRTYSPKKVNYKSNTLRCSQDSDEEKRIRGKRLPKNRSKMPELHFSREEQFPDRRQNSPFNYASSAMYSPEPFYTERRPVDFNSSQPYYTSRYSLPWTNTDFLHKEIFLAKQRLTSSEFGLKSAEQKVNLLKSELSEAQRKNFLELSQRLSEVNYDKLKLEVVDLKNVKII